MPFWVGLSLSEKKWVPLVKVGPDSLVSFTRTVGCTWLHPAHLSKLILDIFAKLTTHGKLSFSSNVLNRSREDPLSLAEATWETLNVSTDSCFGLDCLVVRNQY